MENNKLGVILFAGIVLAFCAISAYAVPPKVTKTIPENGDRNVDPGLRQIRIEFDQDMSQGGYSVCGGGPKYPETLGKPKWINKRTLAMRVKLQPNHEYELSVNCQSYRNFKNLQGESAVIYPVKFKTTTAGKKSSTSTKSPSLLLQEGLYAEETEGDLEKAMEIYQKIIARTDVYERVAAQARYQLGICYMKKGDHTNAAKMFQEVITDFPNQRVIAARARKQLKNVKPETKKESVFEQIDYQVIRFLGEQFGKTAIEAGQQHLSVNSHIYYVDLNGFSYQGGMNAFYNWTGRTITQKVHFGGTSYPNQTHYGVEGNKLNTEIVPDKTRPNHWQIYWIPDEPLAPEEHLYYGWSMNNKRKLSKLPGDVYSLKMDNKYGQSVIETFFLVLPKELKISQSNPPTASQELLNFNAFWWTKTVPQNENHAERMQLKKVPEIVGQWQSVDFVSSPDQFQPGIQQWKGELFLKEIIFNSDGSSSKPWKWTDGWIHEIDGDVKAQYYIKRFDDEKYLFFPWLSGDVTIRGQKPKYYVLKAVAVETNDRQEPGGNIVTGFQYRLGDGNTEFDGDLQKLLDSAQPGDTVIVPDGIYTEPVKINKPLTLKGRSRTGCVIEVTADKPAIFIDTRGKGKASIEDITIKWQLATSDKGIEHPFAVAVKDSNADVKGCLFLPLGNPQRSPVAIRAIGFSDLAINTCRFEGFEYVVCYGEGTKGVMRDSLIMNCGHQGIILYSDATVWVVGNVITGSRFHAVRSTGGNLSMKDNLIIKNENRGVYLGSRSGRGIISNNIIMDNSVGISGFARSKVKIENNLILNSSYAGIAMEQSCSLIIKDNIFQANERGWIMFEKGGEGGNTSYRNTFWKNKIDAENFSKTGNSILDDPRFVAVGDGDFSLQTGPAKENKQGLTNPEIFKKLWKRWQNRKDRNEPFSDQTAYLEESVKAVDKKDKLQAEELTAQGWKLWGQRKLTEAEEKFKEAVAKDPTNDNAYQGLGWAQLNQGKKLNAKDSFEKCVRLNPKNSAALNGLGWIAHGADNIDEAIRWWEKAIKVSNGHATASLSGLTQVYMERKEYDKAIKYYRMWLKAEPDNKQAKDGLEKARASNKNR